MSEIRTKEDWLEIVPGLSIGAPAEIVEIEFTGSMLSEISTGFWKNGYLDIPAILDEEEVAPVREAMYALKAAGIPPVYIYLFDQPWWLFMRLGVLLRHFLGENYSTLPNLWAWHLSREGDKGWPPHRDCDAKTVFGTGENALLMSLSLWLPLTDTDEENGCMYVFPRSREELGADSCELDRPDLFDAKALPAKAGSILGWPQDIYHCGGRYGPAAANPRLSLSLEFQNEAFDPLAEPLIDARNLPPFDMRCTLIDDQFAKYRHIDPVPHGEK